MCVWYGHCVLYVHAVLFLSALCFVSIQFLCQQCVVYVLFLAPIVLLKHEIGKGKRLTSHPSVKDKLSGETSSLSLFLL